MSDDAYRLGYRVETRVRDLTEEEAALVTERLRDWEAQVRRQAMRRVNELRYAVPFAIGVVIIGRDNALVIGVTMSLFLGALFFFARREALALIAASRGPWHAPDGGWKMRETRVAARSIIKVLGDDTVWALYEVPGADWFYVDTICLPSTDLAHADVRFTRLWPDGVFVEVVAKGDALPSHDVARAWKPPTDAPVEGLVAEATLPPAIRALR